MKEHITLTGFLMCFNLWKNVAQWCRRIRYIRCIQRLIYRNKASNTGGALLRGFSLGAAD